MRSAEGEAQGSPTRLWTTRGRCGGQVARTGSAAPSDGADRPVRVATVEHTTCSATFPGMPAGCRASNAAGASRGRWSALLSLNTRGAARSDGPGVLGVAGRGPVGWHDEAREHLAPDARGG